MKITLLCENVAGYDQAEVCLAEWGFSTFIQIDGISLLFDTGHTDVYKKNAQQFGIDLENTDFIILSHHHWDHTGGLRFHNFKNKKKLIAHPEIFEKMPENESQKIKNDFEIISSRESLEFTKNIFYLGEIPRKNDFEDGEFEDDQMLDDSAIAIKSEKGTIVISGCSHAGICNICEYAKRITGQKLYAVIGGFHLFEDNQKAASGAVEYFKKENLEHLYPMHCVDFPTQAKFHTIFNTKKYSTGDIIEIATNK